MGIAGNPLERRRLLGAGLGLVGAGVLAGLATTGTALGQPRDAVDYPAAHWIPASAGNYTESDRPTSSAIDMIIIHVTQETFDDAVKLFQDPNHQAAAHYLTRSADGYLAQLVRERDVAWHAGNLSYNTRSIGIEHEGWIDHPKWLTDAMYQASAALTRNICDRYRIPRDRQHIIGHVEVPGTDHTDPGPYWDWDRYVGLVNA